MSALEIAKSGANLVSDRKVVCFSKSGMCLGGFLWPLLVAGPSCDLAEVTWPIRLTHHQSFERHGLTPRSQSVAAGSTVHCRRWENARTTWNIDGLPSPLRIEGLYSSRSLQPPVNLSRLNPTCPPYRALSSSPQISGDFLAMADFAMGASWGVVLWNIRS